MLHILLTILKILGILILVILGIILAVILLVLLVPVRYRADVSFDGKPKGEILVSWLLRFIQIRIRYDEKVFALVQVLLFRLFDKAVWPSETEESVDEFEESFDEYMEDEFTVEEPKKESSEKVQPKVETNAQADLKPEAKPEVKPEVIPEAKSEVKPDKAQSFVKKTAVPKTSESENRSQGETDEPKVSIVEKLQNLLEKFIHKVTDLVQKLNNKKQVLSEKYDQTMSVLNNPENQKTFKLILRQIGRLIKHVIPRKLTGRVKFGFDDPYTTGQILTYISPFYGMYAKHFSIEPVFDEKVMEGEIHLKGRIRLGSLLWIVIRIILDKNFRRLLKSLLGKKK